MVSNIRENTGKGGVKMEKYTLDDTKDIPIPQIQWKEDLESRKNRKLNGAGWP
jgi:hypothetical protein